MSALILQFPKPPPNQEALYDEWMARRREHALCPCPLHRAATIEALTTFYTKFCSSHGLCEALSREEKLMDQHHEGDEAHGKPA